jgi:hypothetical protein
LTSVITALLLAVFATVSSAQTPQKIIDDYVQAEGGQKALAQRRTANIAGNLTDDSTGKAGSWSLISEAPDRFYMEAIAGTDRAIEAYNGRSPWGQDATDPARTLTGDDAKEVEATARYWNDRLSDVKRSKLGLQFVGIEKVGGRDTYHVTVSPIAGGLARDMFFDTRTHLIAREVLPAEELEYDDYRPVSGIQTPFRIDLRRGGHTYKILVTRAAFNSPVDDAVFDFPHASNTPLPDIAILVREVTKNQKALEELQKQYTCHVTEEQEIVDSKGRVTSKTTREYESFNIGGDDIRHFVARDGKPIEGNEKKKEDERFNKEFENKTREAEAAARDTKKQAKQQEKDDAQISDFLRAVRFTNPRRERFRGEDVIAVDFGPNPDFKPKKAIENVIHQMAGVFWVDEKALDGVRLEAHFNGSVKIAGGVVASLEKGSSFVFEQGRVNNEVWLPTYTEVHLGGRFLFLKVKANQIDRYTDYKKFRAETKFTPEPN